MSYNSVSNLELLWDTDISDARLQMLLDMAYTMISENLSTAGLSTDTLTSIEKWLAIHFGQVLDPISLKKKIGDAETIDYAYAVTTAWAKGLNQTFAGQQAIAMDTSGTLAKLGLMKGAFRAAPREDSDNYTERQTKA